jgi:cysteine desulfurase
MNLPVYLDHNATTPCDPRVLEVMLPYFTRMFGNAASRTHAYGWQAEEAVKFAREQVARLIHAAPEEIIFTSGATEACNLAIKGAYEMYTAKGNHIITVAAEHKAVLDSCRHLEQWGAAVTRLTVQSDGLMDLGELEAAIRPGTILVAVMYANNETGVLQPVKAVSEIARRHGVLFFSDATQAVGKIPVNVMEDGIDLMAFSAHKLYGPKGTGALYVRRRNPRVRLAAQMDGGGHERGLRSGTLNVPGIVGFGKACDICLEEMEQESARLRALRDRLENGLLQIEGTTLNGNKLFRLPHVTNIAFGGTDENRLIMSLNKDLAVSSGSACTSASPEPSHVLRAMGLPDDRLHSSLRFGLGRSSTEEEVDFAVERVKAAVNRLDKETICP